MALLKSVKQLEPFIPKPRENVFDSMITHTPEKVLLTNTVYGITVDGRSHRVTSIFRVAFSLFTAPGASYLFINNAAKELTSATPFIKAKVTGDDNPKLEDWEFEVDEIGLYAKTGILKDTYIYFATSHFDAKDVREAFKKKEENKTLVTETVYV